MLPIDRCKYFIVIYSFFLFISSGSTPVLYLSGSFFLFLLILKNNFVFMIFLPNDSASDFQVLFSASYHPYLSLILKASKKDFGSSFSVVIYSSIRKKIKPGYWVSFSIASSKSSFIDD